MWKLRPKQESHASWAEPRQPVLGPWSTTQSRAGLNPSPALPAAEAKGHLSTLLPSPSHTGRTGGLREVSGSPGALTHPLNTPEAPMQHATHATHPPKAKGHSRNQETREADTGPPPLHPGTNKPTLPAAPPGPEVHGAQPRVPQLHRVGNSGCLDNYHLGGSPSWWGSAPISPLSDLPGHNVSFPPWFGPERTDGKGL